jgi:hypothetical protein
MQDSLQAGAANATRYTSTARFTQSIPFNLKIPLPPPLKRGVDYGFIPGHNFSPKGGVEGVQGPGRLTQHFGIDASFNGKKAGTVFGSKTEVSISAPTMSQRPLA